MNENEEFFVENFEPAGIIEEESAMVIIENKKVEFPEDYYIMHYLPPTVEQIEADKKRKRKTISKLLLNIFQKRQKV